MCGGITWRRFREPPHGGAFSHFIFSRLVVRRDAAGWAVGIVSAHSYNIPERNNFFQRDLSLSLGTLRVWFDVTPCGERVEMNGASPPQLGPGHTSVCKHGGIPNTPGPFGGGIIWHFYRAPFAPPQNAVRRKGVFYFPLALCHNFVICMEVDLTGVERVAFLHRRDCALMDVVKEITSSSLLLQR